MEVTREVLEGIINAYSYEVIFVDRTHTVRFINDAAARKYGDVVQIGRSLFNCHNEISKTKIEEFLARADAGENEMFEVYNRATHEREYFVPVRGKDGSVIGYFERHEASWSESNPTEPHK